MTINLKEPDKRVDYRLGKYVFEQATIGIHTSFTHAPGGTLNFGYSCHEVSKDNQKVDIIGPQRAREILSLDERKKCIGIVIENLSDMLENLDPHWIVVRGPLQADNIVSKRYLGMTDVFARHGWIDWSILYTEKGDYWFHTRESKHIPIEYFPAGSRFKKARIENWKPTVYFDQEIKKSNYHDLGC